MDLCAARRTTRRQIGSAPAQLAYDDAHVVGTAEVGIFAGSLASGAIGVVIVLRARPQR